MLQSLKSSIRSNIREFVAGGSRLDEVEFLVITYAVRELPTVVDMHPYQIRSVSSAPNGALVSHTTRGRHSLANEDGHVLLSFVSNTTVWCECIRSFVAYSGTNAVTLSPEKSFFATSPGDFIVSIEGDDHFVYVASVACCVQLRPTGLIRTTLEFTNGAAPSCIATSGTYVYIQLDDGVVLKLDTDLKMLARRQICFAFLGVYDPISRLLIFISSRHSDTAIYLYNEDIESVGTFDLHFDYSQLVVGRLADGRSVLYAVDDSQLRIYDLEFIVQNMIRCV